MRIPDIIDNRTEPSLGTIISEALKQSKEAAFAVGFFRASGWKQIYMSIGKKQHIRILSGEAMDPETAWTIVHGIRKDLEELDDDTEESIKHLMDCLANGKVEIRSLPGERLHAKAYLFDREFGETPMSIIGSSNLTYQGLATKTELNAVNIGTKHYELALEWFNNLWKEGKDIVPKYREEYEKSQFGKWYTPFEIYVRALIAYVGDEVFGLDIGVRKDHPDLSTFQHDAVARSWSILQRWHGVLIADGVGLGKTFIGKGLIHRFVNPVSDDSRKSVLVICPASLRKMWEDETIEFGFTKVITLESLGSVAPEKNPEFVEYWRREFDRYDAIMIDEAHAFRNRDSNRYKVLKEITDPTKRGRNLEWIFITATPINNKIDDIRSLMDLVTRENPSYFSPDVENVNTLLKKVADEIDERLAEAYRKNDIRLLIKERAKAADELEKLFNLFVIRRTRSYIRKHYEGAKISGKPVVFPKRVTEKREYSLEDTYRGRKLYKEIAENIEKVNFAAYRPETFKEAIKQNVVEMNRQEMVVALIKVLLLKRLESSVSAFVKSVERLIDYQEFIFKQLSDRGVLIDRQTFNERFRDLVEDGADIEGVDIRDLTPQQKHKMEKEIKQDILILKHIKEIVEFIQPEDDDKLQSLKKYLRGQKGKILIFSEFIDTIHYLRDNLKDDNCLLGRKLDWVSSEFSSREKQKKIEDFSPRSNKLDKDKINEETDILLSTDVLSEGLNLQDASVVVNYDLTWNPVKVIQRIGRIDRIGSEHEKISVIWFSPEKGLEELLGIIQTFSRKSVGIAETIGIEGETPTIEGLKDVFSDKNFNTDLDEEDDLGVTFKDAMIGELRKIQELHPEIVESMKDENASKRIKSAKLGNEAKKVMVYEVKYGEENNAYKSTHFFVCSDGDEEENVKKAFELLKCEYNEPLVEAGIVNWKECEKACINEIGKKSITKRGDISSPKRLTGKIRIIKDFLIKHKESELIEKLESVFEKDINKMLIQKWDLWENSSKPPDERIKELNDLLQKTSPIFKNPILDKFKKTPNVKMICRALILKQSNTKE